MMTTNANPLSQSVVTERVPVPDLPVNWARVIQVIWLFVAVISVFVIFGSLPVTYERYLHPCDGGVEAGCLYGQISRATMDDLKASSLPVEWVFGAFVIVILAERLLEIFLSGLMIWYGRHQRYVLLWGFIVLTCSMMVVDYRTALGEAHPLLWLYQVGGWFNGLVLGIAFVTFPDGRFNPRWSLYGVMVFTLIQPVFSMLTGLQSAPSPGSRYYDLSVFLGLASNLFLLAVIVYRFRRVLTQLQRQQAKWLLYSLLMGLASLLLWDVIWMLVDPAQDRMTSAAYVLASNFMSVVIIGLSFIGFTIAILRYRLWDIDIIIQRTLVYGSLTVVVVGAYVLVVGTLGVIFQNYGSLIVSLIATGVVAVVFQPLRERVQHIVNRFVFGERNNPYAVISRLTERLEANVAPGTLLPGIAETVAQALKLPFVAITLRDGDGFKTDAVYGQPADRGRITTLPLQYGQEIVGQIVIGQAAGDRTLDSAERQLLENIAGQTGIAAHAVQLSLALQQSRQHIVRAREEERRRLRRDLHDGLGPALASHTIKIGTARTLIESDPKTASQILNELETSLANSLTDIRHLVYNLRPPALDQLGLVDALDDFIQQCNGTTRFTLQAMECQTALPAAVEVAAYRIVQEAVNNVIRHASAAQCDVRIQINGALDVTIQDDGVGLPANRSNGVGLNSMRERAEELGGELTLASSPGKGTCVHVRIPL